MDDELQERQRRGGSSLPANTITQSDPRFQYKQVDNNNNNVNSKEDRKNDLCDARSKLAFLSDCQTSFLIPGGFSSRLFTWLTGVSMIISGGRDHFSINQQLWTVPFLKYLNTNCVLRKPPNGLWTEFTLRVSNYLDQRAITTNPWDHWSFVISFSPFFFSIVPNSHFHHHSLTEWSVASCSFLFMQLL